MERLPRIDGKRFTATGSGGNSDYIRQMAGKNFPPNTWVSNVIARNGRRLEVLVACITKEGYGPFDKVK